MRRLSMKNKRRKSESMSDSETEENGGARASIDDAAAADADDDNDDGGTQTGRNNNNTRKTASKRRSSRGAPIQKPMYADGDDNDIDVDDDETMKTESVERENGEKTAVVKKSPNKRRKKDDQKASTSGHKSEAEDEYEVQKLVNVRTIKGRRQFLVRWKGYGEASDTWENEKDLNCPDLIEKFLSKEKEKDIKLMKIAASEKSKKAKNSMKKQVMNEEQNNKEEKKESLKEFEVEKIIEVRFKKNGLKEFLIRWKGFTTSDDTWEPEKNLNCPELIAKFMQKVEKAKTAEVRELRTNRVHTKRYTLTTHDKGRRLSKRNRDKQRATYHECDD